jgi:Lauroyl/myristoyl acyltransferase
MIRRKLRAGPELWLARLAVFIVPRLSRPTLCRIARALGGAAFLFGGSRTRRIAEANLELVFPDRSREERQRILKKSLQSFALSMLDIFWLARDTERKIDTLVEFDSSYNRVFESGPCICVTAHMGNWEALGMAISHHAREPLASVAATIKNRRVNELFVNCAAPPGKKLSREKGLFARF